MNYTFLHFIINYLFCISFVIRLLGVKCELVAPSSDLEAVLRCCVRDSSSLTSFVRSMIEPVLYIIPRSGHVLEKLQC